MPWFTVTADTITEQQIKEAALRLITEARKRITPSLK